MKALTVKLPWAWLIIFGHKDIENRDWYSKHRGVTAIHCSKTVEKAEYRVAQQLILERDIDVEMPSFEAMKAFAGKIIGTVDITACVDISRSPWFVGDYGFVLNSPTPLKESIPCRGALGFWEVFAEETKLINEQLETNNGQLENESGICDSIND